MPTCRRKRVLLTEPSPQLLAALESDPSREVFYLSQTGEIFPDYESYSARLSFYKMKQFQCDVTGKSGLDFFQALGSEAQEARTLHARFPEQLKGPVLRAVQWQVMGRLDHLVEAVYERFKDRYYDGERVFLDLEGDKYWGRIVKVTPPGAPSTSTGTKRPRASSSAQAAPPAEIHSLGGNLKTPLEVVNAKDNPADYVYQVHLIDEPGHKEPERQHPAHPPGSLIDVHCPSMSRDRLAFSKSILRRFIRDCVDRDSAIASPWTVKRTIAERYGVEVDMPEETRKGVDEIKRGEIEKRRKVALPPKKEGPPAKKQKKMTAEERAQMLKDEEEELAAIEAAERERELAASQPKKKKKPVKFPAEDLDVRLTEKEKKAGAKVERPLPNRDLPFDSCGPGVFESFLMSWNFLHVFSAPLNLSTFTLDEYEHALRHATADPPCALIAESHVALMSVLRNQHPTKHHPAVVSLMQVEDGPDDVISSEDLLNRLEAYGNNWEKVSLKASEGREGWEDALIGCLKDNASTTNFPPLRRVLTYLLFNVSADGALGKNGRAAEEVDELEPPTAEPGDRYPTMPVSDKIAILSFLCDLAISSKPIHHYMDNCETKLTELRKEKIEVNREKKRLAEEMASVIEKAGVAGGDDPMQVDEDDSVLSDPDDASLIATPLDGSDAGSTAGAMRAATGSMRQRALRQKAQNNALAKQQELMKLKGKGAANALAEHRKLSEEVGKQDRRLDSIEREFRKLLGVVRLRPMGKDRFYNRIWWFDGLGGGNLVNSSGSPLFGAGRIFMQGPSEVDMEMLEVREKEDKDLIERRELEETPEGMLKSNEWATFDDVDQLEEFFAWLNPKGNREVVLKNNLFKWWDHITAGVKKRQADAVSAVKVVDARRSTRGRHSAANEMLREPYMMWTNKLAKTSGGNSNGTQS